MLFCHHWNHGGWLRWQLSSLVYCLLACNFESCPLLPLRDCCKIRTKKRLQGVVLGKFNFEYWTNWMSLSGNFLCPQINSPSICPRYQVPTEGSNGNGKGAAADDASCYQSIDGFNTLHQPTHWILTQPAQPAYLQYWVIFSHCSSAQNRTLHNQHPDLCISGFSSFAGASTWVGITFAEAESKFW